jgi:hypothetical protein
VPIRHEVKQGECLYSIAYKYGVLPDTVWDNADNADLKKARVEPAVLYPSDVLVIPDPRPKVENKPNDARHVFRRKAVPHLLTVRFMNLNVPIANAPYIVTIDGVAKRARTDGDGWARHYISPRASEARFEFDDGDEYHLSLGHLDPVDQVSGIQKRLTNLGYYEGPINGTLDEATAAALARFQAANQLDSTGEINEVTKALLKKGHGA